MDKNGRICHLGRDHNCDNPVVGEALAYPAWYSAEMLMMDGCAECIADANWVSPRIQALNKNKRKKPALVKFRPVKR